MWRSSTRYASRRRGKGTVFLTRRRFLGLTCSGSWGETRVQEILQEGPRGLGQPAVERKTDKGKKHHWHFLPSLMLKPKNRNRLLTNLSLRIPSYLSLQLLCYLCRSIYRNLPSTTWLPMCSLWLSAFLAMNVTVYLR